MHTYLWIAGGKKYKFFGKCCVLTKWLIPNASNSKIYAD